jgi:hypothetical protein
MKKYPTLLPFKHILKILVLSSLLLLTRTQQTYAQVIISEVSPNPVSGESEWVELFNAGGTSISLSGWKLQDKLSSPSDIYLFNTQTIEPQQFLVAELSSAKLNNTSDGVTLFTPAGSVADTMDYTSSEQSKTWQRSSATSTIFQLTTPTKGSDSSQHSLLLMPAPTPTPAATTPPTTAPTPTPAPQATLSPTTTPSPTPVSSPDTTTTPQSTPTPTTSPNPAPSYSPLPSTTPTPTPPPSVSPQASPSPTPSPVPSTSQDTPPRLQLSEIMACPSSGTEWVELYNPTTQDFTLTNWRITDESGTSKLLSGLVQAQKWAVFSWTGSLLNNSGDSFTISTSSNQIISQISYDGCTAGQSLVFVLDQGSTTTGKWVATTPTPAAENSAPPVENSKSEVSTPAASLQPPKATTPAQKTASAAQQTFEALSTSALIPQAARSRTGGAATYSQALHDLAFPNLTPPLLATGSARSATDSAIFIDTADLPPKRLVFGGILSGLVTIGSSCATLYAKKLSIISTALQ